MSPTTQGNGPRHEDYDQERERGSEASRWERDRRSLHGRDDDYDAETRGRSRLSGERGERRERGERDFRGRADREDDRFDREHRHSRGLGDDDRDSDQHYRGIHARSIGRGPGGRGVSISDTYLIVGPFTGRGPKGYKRSDEKITDDVSERLERHGDVDASEIEVTCADGVVTLKGKVGDRASKRLAEDCADDVYGVKDVMNEIRVDKGFFERLFGSGDDDPERERVPSQSRT